MVKLKGYCPMGCGETLFVGSGGYVTCSWHECPAPDAVATILESRETEHVVTFSDDNFNVEHPLRERVPGDDYMTNCELADDIAMLGGPPVKPGRYRATRVGHDPTSQSFRSTGTMDWTFEEIGGP